MGTDEIIKSLRKCCDYSCKCDGCAYENRGACQPDLKWDAADAIEALQYDLDKTRVDRDQWKAVAVTSRDSIQPELRAKIDELERKLFEGSMNLQIEKKGYYDIVQNTVSKEIYEEIS